MKTYTWNGGKISYGLALVADEKLGQVVFLGEAGRGRRFEKIALDKRNPAQVENGRVLEAHVRKVTLPSKRKEGDIFSFFVLETPSAHDDLEAVVVRVNTSWCYTKNTIGRWATVVGNPETLVAGFGAHGGAGRIGNWDDGLVVMRPGDLLKVKPEGGYKVPTYALWIDEGGKPVTATWEDYENLRALEKAKETMAEAEANPNALDVMFGDMPAYSWRAGKLTEGIKVTDGATGKVVSVGEEGRGRRRAEISLVSMEPIVRGEGYSRSESVEQASVVKLDEKGIFGLTQTGKSEDAFLVRIDTSGPYTKGSSGEFSAWKGTPTDLISGNTAGGIAGRTNWAQDGLVVLREGDVLYVRQEGGYKGIGASALYVESSQLKTEAWSAWKAKDAARDPSFYVAKGTAPWGHAPMEWVGKVVTVQDERRDNLHTGELVSIDPLVLNLGWDGQDYHPITVSRGTWVVVEEGKRVRRLEGEALQKRQQLRAEAEELRARAISATAQSYFELTEVGLYTQVQDIAHKQGFETMPTEGWYNSLATWVAEARGVLEKFDEVAMELAALEVRQTSGEVLVDFGGHFRRMGASGNGDFWVVAAYGSLRDPDEVDYRKRYTSEGDKKWRLIGNDELALSWNCGTMNDVVGSSEFRVAKAPVGGCTEAQLEAVARIEDEIGAPRNAFGLHAEIQEVFDRRMEAIRKACARSRVLRSVPDDLDYLSVSGEWGQSVDGDCVQGAVGHFVDWKGEFAGRCENRDAQLIDSQSAGDGVLEFLAYEKWGGVNLNIRWRECREGESGESRDDPEMDAPSDEPEVTGAPASSDRLAALAARFAR